ncbi:venom acid phosphatase Acph-1-like [Belonocnema kinseyi]|uniref:venom acid phosphatase Acph-1-like n=1 Tax=Belonocnema kinseyi TaxID=2817044 RepID=UPI00143D06A0|nr:venom acid phosphatase Acph-1-like [Belonocnema kinseyi]
MREGEELREREVEEVEVGGSKSGKSRAFDLGLFLRDTYNDFLGSTYIPGSVEARCSDVNRTKESSNLILKGLFPAAEVPIKSEDKIEDVLFFPQICPEYVMDYLNANEKPDVKEELAKLEDFMENLSKWTGKNITSSIDMYLLYTTLDTEKFMNLTLPSWTNGIYPDGDLLNGTLLEFKIMNYDEKMRKRNGGRLIKKIKENMESVENGSMDENRKLMLYGAHDLNVVAVLEALGVFHSHVPKFSSAVIVELHLIEKAYYVKINYYLGVPAEVKTLRIPECETLCPLDQFSNLMKNVIPSDLDFECEKLRKEPDFDFETDSGTVETFKKIFS